MIDPFYTLASIAILLQCISEHSTLNLPYLVGMLLNNMFSTGPSMEIEVKNTFVEVCLDGTPTLTQWALACLSLFLVFCRSVRVGVPSSTGRQPSQNGHLHVLPCLWYSVILASRLPRDANPHRTGICEFFPVSGFLAFCEGWCPVVLPHRLRLTMSNVGSRP